MVKYMVLVYIAKYVFKPSIWGHIFVPMICLPLERPTDMDKTGILSIISQVNWWDVHIHIYIYINTYAYSYKDNSIPRSE